MATGVSDSRLPPWDSVPVVLVQALLSTSLLFTLPLSARFAGRRITRWQLLWAVVLATGVAVVVTVGNPTMGRRAPGSGCGLR